MVEPSTALMAEALWLALLIASPACAAAWLAGALTSALGDRVGARDPSLPAFPRIAAAIVTTALTAPWIAEHAMRFGRMAFAQAFGADLPPAQ